MGAPGDDQVFRVGAGLHAEATTHVTHRHPDLPGRQAQQIAHGRAHAGGHLAAHANDQALSLGEGQRGARLQGQCHHALVQQVEFDHVRRLGKRLCHGGCVAIAGLGHAVVAGAGDFVQQGRISGQRILQRHRVGQVLVIHRDGLGRIARLCECFSHHGSDAFPHKAHALQRQHMAWRGDRGCTVGAFEVRHQGHGLEAVLAHVLAGQHAQHAGHAAGGFGVDRDDARVRVGRAQKVDEGLPLRRHIVGKTSLPLEQEVVFDPRHGLAAAEFLCTGIHAVPDTP